MESEKILSSQINYIIQVDTLFGFFSPLVIDTLDAISTSLLLYESFYYWRIKAFDLAGNQCPYFNPDSFGVDITAPLIDSTTLWSNASFAGPFEIRTKTIDELAGIDSVYLYYKRNEDPEWISTVMNLAGLPDWFLDSIPSVSIGSDTVRYYIKVIDASQPGNMTTDPEESPIDYYWFIANYDPCITESGNTSPHFFFGLKTNPAKEKAIFYVAAPHDAFIVLHVYDVAGRLIDRPISGRKSAGYHQIPWAPEVNAGIYFYILESPWQTETGKLVFIR